MGLKKSQSCDADDVQIKTTKYVIDIIVPILVHIFNPCVSTGVFPFKMQIARVIPLYKKGSKNSVTNYRTTSILPAFLKG